jgi:Protein of unknown function (DUF1353)
MKPGSATQDGFEGPFVGSSLDGHNWVATAYFYWWWQGRRYRCIIGATTDGASTPQVGWNLIPPFGWYWLAALAHDFAYRAQCEVQNPDGTWTRIQMAFDDANQMLLDLMASLQTGPLQEGEKRLIYEAVHRAGQTAFSDDLAMPIPKT